MNDDLKHLQLLSLFHYIVGGICALFSSMFLIHLFLGLAVLLSPESLAGRHGTPPPAFVGYLFSIMGGVFFLMGISLATCIIYSGSLLRRQKKHMFSLVVACIECIFMPFGTVLGVFTILVLARESVKKLYGVAAIG